MYSYCNNCDFLFKSIVFGSNNAQLILTPGIRVDFSNMGVAERCPRCGGLANMLKGEYAIDVNGLESFLSGPEFSTEILERFNVLVKKAKDEKYTPEQILEEAVKISPAFSKLREFILSSKGAFIQIVLSIISSILYDLIKPTWETPPPSQTINTSQTTITNNRYDITIRSSNPYKFSGTNKKGLKKKGKRN